MVCGRLLFPGSAGVPPASFLNRARLAGETPTPTGWLSGKKSFMKNWFANAALGLALTLGFGGSASAMDPDFARFVGEKARQIREFEKTSGDKAPAVVWSYFDALRVDDWETATNLANRIDDMGRALGTNEISPALQGPIWQPIGETIGAYDQFHDVDNRWLHRFGSNILSSIPKGSVYFGGTDSGRYIISALSESQTEGVPIFTLTQNQLIDRRYAEYIRLIYGSKLKLPSDDDLRSAVREYTEDAEARYKAGKIKPGEDVHLAADGHAQVSGAVAVMGINALLVKQIFQNNPAREFYIEESYPLGWMYPQLEPHGLIMELNRRPLERLGEETVQKDFDFWKRQTADAVGSWLNETNSIRDLCAFCEKVYLRKDLSAFKGDPAFAKSKETQKTFSKLRSSLGGLYVWHFENDKNADDKQRMKKAADLAFRQAFALCPYSPEAVYRYSLFLMSVQRLDDALLIAETAARIDPDNDEIGQTLKYLHRAKMNE